MGQGKVSDEQILIASLNVEKGATVTSECRRLGITSKTFYLRRKRLESKQKDVSDRLQSVTSALPITLQTIQGEIQAIISELKGMKARDTREKLSIMDRQINALDKLNNTLKTTQIMIDNRSVNIEVRGEMERDVCRWVHDVIEKKGGTELADRVLAMLTEG